MFTKKDVAEYYNTTQIHYTRWWNLKKGLSLHYGIWENGVKTFRDSLINTNKILMSLAEVEESDRVLDAGCGVGGAAIFLSEMKNANVTGISLSQKQVDFATIAAQERGLQDKVDFQLMDYTQTSFPDESFDVIWACESISSAPDKTLFIKEANRLLKKGGRLVLSDFFLKSADQTDAHDWIKKWGDTWGISNFVTSNSFAESLDDMGFKNTQIFDYTSQIKKSAKRMYCASLLGFIPSELYNLLHPNVSRFAKTHYKCGYYQYKGLKENLWQYKVLLSVKKDLDKHV